MDKIKSFFGRWQDGVIWLPIAIALLMLATFLLPTMDPNASVDGLGFLQGYAILLMKGVLITFLAWLCKRTYTRDLTDGDEVNLINHAGNGNPWPLLIDRLEWAGWLLLWYLILSN